MSFNNRKRIGILGGGQLGRMLIQAGISYDITTHILDNDPNAPCRHICHSFTQGQLMNYDTVYRFGKQVDVLTIEIEHVNVDALIQLEKEGLEIIPSPAALKIIQDKGLQKQFYLEHGIPSPEFRMIDKAEDLHKYEDFFPAFQKLRRFGYDGKGVISLKNKEDIYKAFHESSLLEKYIDFEKEVSVIVVRNKSGQTTAFPPVELLFDPKYNLVDYLLSPARLSEEQEQEARIIAMKVADALNSPGIFAVEMFMTKAGHFLVNETAPRAHNSGHQTIEGNYSSQFDQQIRTLLDLPLGNTETVKPSLMMNIVGKEGFSGPVIYEGLDKMMALPGVYVHLYGKKETRPGRKMGHFTLLGETHEELLEKAQYIKEHLIVRA